MAVRKLYVKPETHNLSVGGEDLMGQEIVPVVSDGETEANDGLFDDEDEKPKCNSIWVDRFNQ